MSAINLALPTTDGRVRPIIRSRSQVPLALPSTTPTVNGKLPCHARANVNEDGTSKSHQSRSHFERLKKSHMPTFDGSSDPENVENWISKMESNFEDVKVILAKPFLVEKVEKLSGETIPGRES
ncbi:hypothetical protein M9H77_18422 [Catharanthus roseus]|uniref:Uncharacterized protein n=1 Tax=Catharanthus roseus TaxID=4058 RepID=A0ACC0B7D7_CATRO|nr:hypothetical protein M9H77_18422 [Catharanthus roseus]